MPELLDLVNISAGWSVPSILREDGLAGNCLRTLRDSFDSLPGSRTSQKCDSSNPDIFNIATEPGKKRMLQLLRDVAGCLTQGRPLNDERRCELELELLSGAQALQASIANHCRFRYQGSWTLKARKYPAIKLIDFFWVSGALLCDADLRETLKHACSTLLPPDLAKEAVLFVDGKLEAGQCNTKVPSSATLCRLRARLDVCYTLLMRQWLMQNLQMSGGCGVKVFIQTDATWQSKKEYQITVMNFLLGELALPVHKDSGRFLW